MEPNSPSAPGLRCWCPRRGTGVDILTDVVMREPMRGRVEENKRERESRWSCCAECRRSSGRWERHGVKVDCVRGVASSGSVHTPLTPCRDTLYPSCDRYTWALVPHVGFWNAIMSFPCSKTCLPWSTTNNSNLLELSSNNPSLVIAVQLPLCRSQRCCSWKDPIEAERSLEQ